MSAAGATAPPPADAPSPSSSIQGDLGRGDLAGIAAARVAVSVALLAAGFRAVSDDDFARVVIAQQWARSPRLDPTGTSWLPLPFWLNGGVMLVFGRSLLVAQIVAVVLGVASSLLVAISAHRITGDRRAAVLAGFASTLVGWSAWLGVATVPELLTASLTLFAAASLTTGSARERWLGAAALGLATLSRYEPWPVAIAFAAWNVASPAGRAEEAAARGSRARVATRRGNEQPEGARSHRAGGRRARGAGGLDRVEPRRARGSVPLRRAGRGVPPSRRSGLERRRARAARRVPARLRPRDAGGPRGGARGGRGRRVPEVARDGDGSRAALRRAPRARGGAGRRPVDLAREGRRADAPPRARAAVPGPRARGARGRCGERGLAASTALHERPGRSARRGPSA